MSQQSGNNPILPQNIQQTSVRWRWLFLGLSAFTLCFLGNTSLLPRSSQLARAQSIELLPVFKFGSRTLELGMAGTDVAELQSRLRQLGYFDGNATGVFDRATQASVTQFQRDFRFDADGKAGVETLTALLESDQRGDIWQILPLVGLRQGSVGIEVQQLQLLLQNNGFPPGNIDSRFGTDTQDALVQFQRYYGLTQTGVVDKRTANRLVRVNNPLPVQTFVPEPEIEAKHLYVVVIPQRNDELLLQDVRGFFPNATLVETDRRGVYIEVGRFLDRDFAQNQSNNARDRGFDARVVYLRNQSIASTDESSLQPFNIPTLRPLPVPF
ncbi:MAG: peptidoglycan-binding protein [Geitlerinemataceae cyanobacterium]